MRTWHRAMFEPAYSPIRNLCHLKNNRLRWFRPQQAKLIGCMLRSSPQHGLRSQTQFGSANYSRKKNGERAMATGCLGSKQISSLVNVQPETISGSMKTETGLNRQTLPI